MLALSKKIPINPGVYTFRSRGGIPLYIGKASNLRKRLVSYWRRNVSDKIKMMLAEATKVDWIETGSEIDALIKEAELIKAYITKYNILMRDDKNYFCVGITKEKFPRIFITHQPFASAQRQKIKEYIGPFTSGAALKSTLRLLRSVFPYCTCTEVHKRPCLNSEIGHCPGYCCFQPAQSSNILHPPTQAENVGTLEVNGKEYRKNIRGIIAVLCGRKKKLLAGLKREMREASKRREFEKAAKVRDQVLGLENIAGHSVLTNRELMQRPHDWSKIQKNLEIILGIKVSRAEGYDISNISGTEATGSMVVFTEGRPDKDQYRKFKIGTVAEPNDIAMHKEVIKRRLQHPEWKFPDLMLIDGGKAQLNAALSVVKSSGLRIKVASLAKREEELYIEGKNLPIKLAS